MSEAPPKPRQVDLKKVVGFGLVGVAGFVVDAGVLTLVEPELGRFGGRALSFVCAVATTFVLNRTFVFEGGRDKPLVAQAGLFVAANSVGMLINNAVYAVLMVFHVMPVLGVAAGSLAGAVSNFLATDRIVFKARPGAPRD